MGALLAACGGGGEARKQESQCRLVRVDWDHDAAGNPVSQRLDLGANGTIGVSSEAFYDCS